jgi:outer membrane murein-binding lipoprotein Lpp
MRLDLDVQEINAVMALLASLMDKIRMQAQAQIPETPQRE